MPLLSTTGCLVRKYAITPPPLAVLSDRMYAITLHHWLSCLTASMPLLSTTGCPV
ncbi:hypothetical protein DPMN_061181 [Dreissena polymorpha]|uniref:Uncharacterized protein n=1 Tax=Dreissena polymorpha TaxID=45954 RepID=A0A9D4C7D2_DREPO|nr:hypothetical protein DPMN_061181 [Dreissena polymorpha]